MTGVLKIISKFMSALRTDHVGAVDNGSIYTMENLSTLNHILDSHTGLKLNPTRKELIKESIDNDEVIVLSCGALATWTPPDQTGRCPKDTYVVKHAASSNTIDWNSPTNIPMSPQIFDALWEDAMSFLKNKKKVYVIERVIGADSSYALPTKVVTDRAVSALFSDNMFRQKPSDLDRSIFADEEFTILSLPWDKVDPKKYANKLRTTNDNAEPRVCVLDLDRKLGLILGTLYCGTIKKTLFTAMNYYLPEKGILPLHCSANEGPDGKSALFLGLSGTGKTTLSSDESRALIGDDEHGWSDNGIANFEGGCYAKLIDLDPNKEPEIHHASFRQADVYEHGSIIENCMVYPDGTWDVKDARFSENSRVSYPLTSLSNVKKSAAGSHPDCIIFLTADANGVLPPVAKLNRNQAMLWFLMGYTSKLAGTETGVTEPVTTFSRFFGGPFMARNPGDYTSLFGQKIDKYNTRVYLINTGWTGGPYGVGKRFDIKVTRNIVNSALYGTIEDTEWVEDKRFHFSVPKSCPDVDAKLLDPKNTWTDVAAYEAKANKLAADFSQAFDKAYGSNNIEANIIAECPGK
ncbi:MAG: phosphoenolpyruvate carboxykinase (ATP) [Bdellovibrionales bacterium]|nr:phosphoenolpyruvate carboxykinase (ATP) [Bdellovibrionales bacterium]